MISLNNQKCVPCEGGIDPLKRSEFEQYLDQVKAWKVIDDKELEREFVFKNFKESLEFVNKVGAIAEEEGHHPDIFIHGWSKVRLSLVTHAIKGLSINDFVLASKIDQL